MVKVKVSLVFTEEALGTASANPDIYREFIESKRPPDANGNGNEEVEALPTVDEEVARSMTVFSRDEDGVTPILWDYQIKGFFKDACGMLRYGDEGESKAMKAFKKRIDGAIFVQPRRIRLVLPEGGKMGTCSRPLRAQTAQGDRVALAHSETVPVGTRCEFIVVLLAADMIGPLQEWLEYGALRGLAQWRNSGKGRFSATMEVVKA
jgi:hypothetical protein